MGATHKPGYWVFPSGCCWLGTFLIFILFLFLSLLLLGEVGFGMALFSFGECDGGHVCLV